MDLEWKNPPPPKPTRASEVMEKLRSRPGHWAKIDHGEAVQVFVWWDPIYSDPEFEVKIVHLDSSLFGPRDIYARFNPKP